MSSVARKPRYLFG